jgi:peptide/nickel transport system permease protein
MGGLYNITTTLIWGTRSALYFGLAVALITALFGVFVGSLSGYFGGLLGRLIMHVTDGFLSIPVIAGIVLFRQLLSLAMGSAGLRTFADGTVVLEAQPNLLQQTLLNFDPVMLALILFSWMPYARIMNAVVVDARQAEFIQAARALGASHLQVILRHLIPNTISPAVVLAARDIGSVVLLQATFTFIGMGGGSDWGELLVLGRNYIIGPGGNPLRYWWVFIPATLTLVFFGIGWNLLGDGLNVWLNPKVRTLK